MKSKSFWHPKSVLLLFRIASGCSAEPVAVPQDSTGQLAENELPSMSFSELVDAAIGLRNTIRDGFANGDVDAAHEPLHEIGHIILEMPEAAEKDLKAADVDEVVAVVEELMDAFGAVDKTLHGGDGSTYEEEALTIDKGIETLAKIAGIQLSAEPPTNEPQPENTENAAPAIEDALPIEDAPPIQDAVEIQDASSPPAP